MSFLSPELAYVALLFTLFVVPRTLQRWRLPAAITAFAIGAVSGIGFGHFVHDPTVNLLATFGIVSLFLFAGLEVELHELRRHAGVLTQHLIIRLFALAGVAWLAMEVLGLGLRPAALVSLALLTPSTGFILDAIASLGVGEQERFWVKSKAIATELLALVTLLVTLQSTSPGRFALSAAVLGGMIVLLPAVFSLFARRVAPAAPKSEFAFLLMVAVVCAYVTRELGVYYLVGAFVVGMAAQRFQERLPAMTSREMLHAVEVFASFFVPFYFFHAGLDLRREDFTWGALALGAVALVVMVPFRILLVVVHRRIALREPMRRGVRMALCMSPTLVFTLVIAQILRDRFQVAPEIFGGLIVYTVVNTMIPGFLLHVAPPDYVHLPHPEAEAEAVREAG